ncbi:MULTISPECIES: histone methylation protein DOT1-like protein [unclassified Duganella]|uniref:histone methylation protein DOT1-like protein n=1 Tax=unclassified Duganella TaxID=2636909 RepID=UPI000E3416CA|nr:MULTISPECIES: histone methylation protein DOT1-like protein [unclassified Duganella]RFP11927.1 histone methylation protein DOT1-like protein [Duganella sp. BJB475]RFP30063.1 histone methylation protein DOT1-like protein [Duganella sp. BJB476]
MQSPPVFRTQDAANRPVASFQHPDDVFETLFQSIQGGEQHVRPPLELKPDSPFLRFIEVGYALRACLEDKSRRDYLLQRLRPHLSVITGTLPAGLLPHGMLPRVAALPGFRSLEQIGDAEVRAWLVEDGGLIYGEFRRYELDNYFDAIAASIRPGGVMVDLGSGLGKVVMSAALAFPFQRCIGVELIGYRHAMAVQRLHNLLALARQALAALPSPLAPETPLQLPFGGEAHGSHLLDLASRIAFIEADMFRVDVRGASLVFMYSTCFGPLMDALGDKLAREMQEGALVSTTTYPLRHPAFKLLCSFPAGTVAWTNVMLYQRTGPLEYVAPTATLYEPDPAAWEERVRQEFVVMDDKASK